MSFNKTLGKCLEQDFKRYIQPSRPVGSKAHLPPTAGEVSAGTSSQRRRIWEEFYSNPTSHSQDCLIICLGFAKCCWKIGPKANFVFRLESLFFRFFSWTLTPKSVSRLSTTINTSFNITILSTSIVLASSMARETVSEWSPPSGNAGWGASQGGGVGGVFAFGGVAGGAGVFTWWTFFLDPSWRTWLLNIIVWITAVKSVGGNLFPWTWRIWTKIFGWNIFCRKLHAFCMYLSPSLGWCGW